MPKKALYCEECQVDCTVSYKGDSEIHHCPFCGAEIDVDWYATEEVEE